MSYNSATKTIIRGYRFTTALDAESGDPITQAQHDAAHDEVVADVNAMRADIASASVIIDNFTGDGSTTTFALTGSPVDENTLFIHIDGIYQNLDTLSLIAGDLVFSAAPPNLSDIEVKQFSTPPVSRSVTTFLAGDTTPSVLGGLVFLTDAGSITITDFDDGAAGQEITIISKGAVTFDTTGTDLTGSSVDLVTASGDVTRWVCEDGTTWRLMGFVNASADNSVGA